MPRVRIKIRKNDIVLYVFSFVDPFKNCRRLFSSHFWDRSKQRSISEDYVFTIIDNGTKSHTGNSKYEITYRQWTIIAKLYKCRLMMKTVFHG